MGKRLKLYDEVLRLNISKKDKNKFRKLAFKNQKTMSEFARSLIKFAVLVDELDSTELSKIKSTSELDKVLLLLGRDN